MKVIQCDFESYDLAQQATHSLRQQGYHVFREAFSFRGPSSAEEGAQPVAVAGSPVGFGSMPVPDSFVLLPHKRREEKNGCTVYFSCPDEEISQIHGRLLNLGGSRAIVR